MRLSTNIGHLRGRKTPGSVVEYLLFIFRVRDFVGNRQGLQGFIQWTGLAGFAGFYRMDKINKILQDSWPALPLANFPTC